MTLPVFLRSRRNWLLIGGGVLALLIVLAFIGSSILSTHSESRFARGFAKVMPLPAAKVGSRWIWYREYLRHIDSQAIFLQGPAAQALGYPKEMTDDLRQGALERAIRMVAVDQVATQQNLIVTPLDVDRSYQSLVTNAPVTSTHEELEGFLRTQFGWNEVDFKRYVVRPALIEDALIEQSIAHGSASTTAQATLEAQIMSQVVRRFVRF